MTPNETRRALRPLLVANYDHVLGGGEVGLAMLADALVARGDQPLVAIPGVGRLPTHAEQCTISGDPDGAAADIARLSRDRDLVHTWSAPALVAAWRARSGRPLVYHELLQLAQPYDMRVARLADAVVCNTQATARRFTGIDAMYVVLNGVRAPRPVTATAVPTGPTHRGRRRQRLSPQGPLDVLPALRAVMDARADVDLAFVGRTAGAVGAALRAAGNEARTGGRIHLPGFVPDVGDHLGEFALVVVPSRSEGFGRVAVEALRAGTPVLATRVGGLVEALEGLTDPWLPVDRSQWATRILAALDAPIHDPDELRRAGARFEPSRFVDGILAVYHELGVGEVAAAAR